MRRYGGVISRSGLRLREHIHLLLEALCWWALLFVVYLSLLSSLSAAEIVVGAGVAALGGVLAVLARRAERTAFRVRLRWVRWLPALLADLFTDTVALAAPLARALGGRTSGDGRIHRLELPPEPRADVARTRRAILTVLVSLTPGTYVIDARAGDRGADELSVHRLGRRERLGKLGKAVSR